MSQSAPTKLGLTGSIGMGKSTTAKMFSDHGCDVWDADAAVHRLYGPSGLAVGPVQALCPGAVSDRGVDRHVLKEWLSTDASALKQLEQVVHPLVAADRDEFYRRSTTSVVVFDIPLLFENGTEKQMDHVAVVSVSPDIQRKRVLERPGMTEEQFQFILSKQMPNEEKCARADFVIDTATIENARSGVKQIMENLGVPHA